MILNCPRCCIRYIYEQLYCIIYLVSFGKDNFRCKCLMMISQSILQLSLLTIFYDILEEQKSRPQKEYENIVDFLKSLTRRMLRKMKNYPLLLVEVLFVKTRKESHYINCGSMLNELNSIKNESGEGRNGTKKSGSGFFDDQKWVRRNLADALGDDDYDNQE